MVICRLPYFCGFGRVVHPGLDTHERTVFGLCIRREQAKEVGEALTCLRLFQHDSRKHSLGPDSVYIRNQPEILLMQVEFGFAEYEQGFSVVGKDVGTE